MIRETTYTLYHIKCDRCPRAWQWSPPQTIEEQEKWIEQFGGKVVKPGESHICSECLRDEK